MEFWGFEGQDFCLDLKSFVMKILSTAEPPLVFSISYGWQGPLTQIQCASGNAADVDIDLSAIAARGISVIISSGDSGSAEIDNGPPPPPPPLPAQCRSPTAGSQWNGQGEKINARDADECCVQALENGYAYWTFVHKNFFSHTCQGFKSVNGSSPEKKATSGGGGPPVPPPPPPPPNTRIKLYPSWPASSPWVTAVGATRFINQDPTGKSGEMATDQFGSGGGFSSMFPQSPNATWQISAVKGYLSSDKDIPPPGTYDPNGRGTPDVSALGEGFQVLVNSRLQSVGGTSASAPTFAAIISLLNDARMQAGKPALGFLNPWIYANADMFTDVVTGSNKIGRSGQAFKYGWDCLPGWDAATGFGTPIFSKMLAAAMKK
jgi:hypothetical protein